MAEPEDLGHDKCRELLTSGIVGRVAFVVDGEPHVVPVNYTTVGEAVVFRTSAYSLLARALASGDRLRLAFEIDQLDYADHRGWSVVAHGTGEHLEDVSELADETPFWNPQPWASGTRAFYVRMPWSALTGRRLGGGWTYTNEMPVRRPG